MTSETPPTTDQPLLDTVDVARQLGIAAHTVKFWRGVGKGPSFVKVGSLVRYRQSDVDAYLAAHTHQPEAA